MGKGQDGFTYEIEPSIGVARVGDAEQFYLSPETIGGRPIECDRYGNTVLGSNGMPAPVDRYKDDEMRVKRQGARFRVMRYTDAAKRTGGTEITLRDVANIEWTVHVANKKAAWYNFDELLGNLYWNGSYDPSNSYVAKHVELRNAKVIDPAARKALIIDPGPRTLTGAEQQVAFSRDTIPPGYTYGSFPIATPSQGYPINSLGNAVTDKDGRLVVIGAFGRAGGDEPISSYGGANTWHDDIADGAVACKLTLTNGDVINLDAWVIVGSPKFAPELVNITTVDDILYDVGVRYQNLDPELYSDNKFNGTYQASYEDDIRPILERMAGYQWVANTQAMTAAATPGFDLRDRGPDNMFNRRSLFAQFRKLDDTQTLWAPNRAPAMPLNSGTNSVTEQLIVKFSTVTATQYFLLEQWSVGHFTPGPRTTPPKVSQLDRAGVGNATGEPVSPGIEVTWNMRNPTLYDRPFHIKHRHDAGYYRANGLAPLEDETAPVEATGPSSTVGRGCEPGDLTKRMAIPWQADFFQCTLQYVNFSDPNINKVNGIPLPPTYYAYWWPPQSPWDVLAGATTVADQAATGTPAGVQVNYARGINSFIDMITGWKYLGFIHNQTEGDYRRWYPYFVEVERNNDRFAMASVAVGGISNVLDPTNVTFIPTWFLRDQHDADGLRRAMTMRGITSAAAGRDLPRPITASPHLGLPRNGRVIR